jgi:hypothetical protein
MHGTKRLGAGKEGFGDRSTPNRSPLNRVLAPFPLTKLLGRKIPLLAISP